MATVPRKARPPVQDWMSVVVFDGKGDAKRLAEEQEKLPHEVPAKGFVLITGNSRAPEFRQWVAEQVSEPDAELMFDGTNKSRCIVLDDKALVMLSLPGATSDNNGSAKHFMSIWLEANRVIITSELKVLDVLNIERWQKSHHAPVTPAEFVARHGLRSADRIEPVIERLGDGLDEIEEQVLGRSVSDSRQKLTHVRHKIISLRRLIWPQRDVLNTLEIEDLSFLSARDRTRLRESSSRLERLGNELQVLSERAALVHEQIIDTRAEQMNKTMLLLTAVTVILLPLTVISGVLGMNVAGIPFADSPHAFWVVAVVLGVIGVALYLLMRRVKWL
jgi:zinc transporter